MPTYRQVRATLEVVSATLGIVLFLLDRRLSLPHRLLFLALGLGLGVLKARLTQ